MKQRGPITTHILDIHRGRPATGVPVTLEMREGGGWKNLAQGETDADGRIEDLLPRGSRAEAGTYQLSFDTQAYFRALGIPSFYPRVSVVFELSNPDQHHHVPLLLSAHGYSTYRGT